MDRFIYTKTKRVIPVCYCGNRPIFGGILMSVMSLVKNTDETLDIMLVTMDLSEDNPSWLPFSEEQRALMDRVLKSKNPASRARIIDVTALQRKYFSGAKNQKNKYTPYASIRLFLDLLDDIPDKLVYLDADIMCLGDVARIYDINIEKYEFAAAPDVVRRRFTPNYCNSGVMLLNMPYIRRSGLFEKAREKVRTTTMLLPDQSALNFQCESKLILPYAFNEQRNIRPSTLFKHFCMKFFFYGPVLVKYNYKQWHRDKVHEKLHIHNFDDIYAEFDALMAEGNNAALMRI